MRVILTLAALASLSLTSNAFAAGKDMYCSSNDVSSTLFLHASKNQYVFKQSSDSVKINDTYNSQSNKIADNKDYSIELINGNQVLIKLKASGLEYVLTCR